MKRVLSTLLALSLLVQGIANAAITRGATLSSRAVAFGSAGTDLSITHTVDSSTTLLVVSIMLRADQAYTGTPQWSLGGGENLTLIDETTPGPDTQDMKVSTWGLVNPTSGAGAVTIMLDADLAYGIQATATNYLGTVTTSVGDATNFLAEDVQNGGSSNTTTFASAGTSGNTLYAAGAFKGGDGDGITPPTNFAEIYDGESGPSVGSDHSSYVTDYIGGAPSAASWTWASSDEHASHYVEIVPAAGSALPVILQQH